METLFSTKDIPPRHRFDYWHEVACRHIVKHDSKPECRLKFHATMQLGMLADVGIILFENSPMDFAHTSRQVAHATINEVFVCQQLCGRLKLEQNGREALLNPGDITLVDPLRPYTGKFSCTSNMLVLKVPRRALEARVGAMSEIVARSITPSGAEGSLASSYLAMLPAHAGRICPTAEEIAKDQALDLVAVSLAKMMGGSNTRSTSDRVLLGVNAATKAQLNSSPPDTPHVGIQPWSKMDLFFLVHSLRHGRSLLEVAGFLRRKEEEVRAKAKALKLR